ncbi:hypothetical protein ACE5IS_18125 [Leptospira wolffii]|uniref:Uncharacterized protein n=1 Tax=Leptospira wolffii TaxID=409998 RepID=A0ABV5BSE5_9LEPT
MEKNRKSNLITLPFPSTYLVSSPQISLIEGDFVLFLKFADDNDNLKKYIVKFNSARAFRKRSEIHCTVWHIAECYDTVCEVFDSTWVDELIEDTVPDMRSLWTMRHFILYLDSFGCLEVTGKSVEIYAQ